jgi:hypothetical protein
LQNTNESSWRRALSNVAVLPLDSSSCELLLFLWVLYFPLFSLSLFLFFQSVLETKGVLL